MTWTVKRIGQAGVAPLIKALKDRIIRRWAVTTLSQMKKTAHTAGPALVALLRRQFVAGGNPEYRAAIFLHPIRTTGNVPLAVTMIRRALVHRDANVRAGAAWATWAPRRHPSYARSSRRCAIRKATCGRPRPEPSEIWGRQPNPRSEP